jgi:hypothetical protein
MELFFYMTCLKLLFTKEKLIHLTYFYLFKKNLFTLLIFIPINNGFYGI